MQQPSTEVGGFLTTLHECALMIMTALSESGRTQGVPGIGVRPSASRSEICTCSTAPEPLASAVLISLGVRPALSARSMSVSASRLFLPPAGSGVKLTGPLISA